MKKIKKLITGKQNYQFLGRDFPRKDGVARVTGKEIYPSDLFLPGMLYGKVLRSPHAHARIRSIDCSEAEKMGAFPLTYQDVPSTFSTCAW